MICHRQLKRNRSVRPELSSLEGRELLNAAMPHHLRDVRVSAEILEAKPQSKHGTTPVQSITVLGQAENGGFSFTNFNGPNAGTNAGDGTTMDGVSNKSMTVGFDEDNSGVFHNYIVNWNTRTITELNIHGSTSAMANGINSAGTVVGTDGNTHAFYETKGKVTTFIPLNGMSAVDFGINDKGAIVGQVVTSTTTPGFIRVNKKTVIEINAPSGPDVVNAQGINNNGLVIGFYQGTDGQVHGFKANEKSAKHGRLTGTAIADPTIPNVPGEPGATFVFSQILGINDHGIAVGYYGDSTTSQHGFIYNTNTGQYSFLDDPSEAFCNGVEVTQITGINNAGQITGFYSDANGVFHGFVAQA
jgi:probable HAF family extracellular repeat protein